MILTHTAAFDIIWNKADSHIEEKLRENPKRKLNRNELVWQLKEAADKLVGQQRLTGQR